MHARIAATAAGEFRPDIEGLRAVAILIVVAAHAKIRWFEGGFVGVDVFFVLSGYLITGLLLGEWNHCGSIDLKKFYARRIQRLLPGLALMVAVVWVAAMLLLAPSEHGAQAASGASALTWSSNFYFAFQAIDYFAPDEKTSLFLHSWSLGVEEQFYLAWPALLLIFLRRAGRTNVEEQKQQLIRVMVALLAIGMPLSLLLTFATPELGFYMPFSRAWQFALGAFALLVQTRPSVLIGNSRGLQTRVARNRALAAAGWVGLLAIIAASLIIDGKMRFPGFWAWLPSFATALVLIGAQAPGGAGMLLSTRAMQAIGAVSYSWYLWHWPTLILGAMFVPHDDVRWNLLLVGISFALACMAHRAVEAPIRQSMALRKRPSIVLASALAIATAGVVVSLAWSHAAKQWKSTPSQMKIAAATGDVPIIYRFACDDWFHSARVQPCYFGKEDASRTVALFGDSLVAQWFPALEAGIVSGDLRVLVLTKSACPMIDLPYFYARLRRPFTECSEWRDSAIEFLLGAKPDLVIVGSAGGYEYSDANMEAGTSDILRSLTRIDADIVVVQRSPRLPFNGLRCLARRSWTLEFLGASPVTCSATVFDPEAATVRESILRAAAPFPKVRVADLSDVVCPSGQCSAQLGDMIVFRDADHLTSSFVRTLSGAFALRVLSTVNSKARQRSELRNDGGDPQVAP